MDALLASIHSFDTPTLPAAADLVAEQPLRRDRGTAWQQIAGTLGWRPAAASPAANLCAAREACIGSLADLPWPDVRALCQLLGHANSLAELWHLRPELYRLLALHHSQAEAERRLMALGPVFDERAAPPRAQRPR